MFAFCGFYTIILLSSLFFLAT